MGFRDDLSVSRTPALGLAAIGAMWGSVAAWLPTIKARAGVGDAEFGAIMVLSAVGGMAAMALAPRVLARVGPRVLPLSVFVVAAVTLLPAWPTSRLTLAAAVFILGASMSLTDILSNIRISDIEAQVGRSLQNLNHALFSLALAVTAGAMGLARAAGVPHLAGAAVMAAIIAAMALMMRDGEARRPAMAETPVRAAPWALILPGAAILWLSFMAENGTETWGALHIERSLGVGEGIGAYGPAVFGLTMGLARLGGQALVRHLGEVRLLAVSVVLACAGASVLATAPGLGAAMAGAGALGLGVAVVVPTTNTLIARLVPPEQRASAIARAWMFGFTGFFIGPPVMGLISEGWGLRAAFGAIAALVALMAPCLWVLARRLQR